MAGRMQMKIQSQRSDCLRMPRPTRRVKKMLMAPEGVFIRAARLGEKPRLRIRVAE